MTPWMLLSGQRLFQLQYLAMEDDDAVVAAELAKKVLANLGG